MASVGPLLAAFCVACLDPTAPLAVIDPSCTISTLLKPNGSPAVMLRACYKICPDSAEAQANAAGQQFQRGYQC